MYPGSVQEDASRLIFEFCRDTGQLIIITIPRVCTLHVFLLLARVCVCVCAWIRAGSSRPEETPNGVLHAYRSIFGSITPSLSLSRVLSSLPHRDLWNVSNRTNPFSSSQLTLASWKPPLHLVERRFVFLAFLVDRKILHLSHKLM